MNMLDKIRAKKQMVRAVIYARFSSDNQRDESIDAQIRAISEYAKKNEIVIVGEYIDKARSAMTDNRPEFLKMISEASEQKFDIVLVHKLDRFARNRQDSIGYRMQLKRHGVSLVSVLEYIDESPESIILESVLEAMAEYYSKNLAREVQKGMKENALKGLHTGGKPPFGYDVDPETKKLVINEKEACAVRLIFDRFIEGYGYDKIMNELNAHGYRTKCGNPFGKNSLHGIVRNEKYTGTYIFNRSAAKDVDGKRNNHKNKEDDEIIRLDDAVPAIISKNIFEQVQRKIVARKNNKPSNKAKEVYLLSGKIYCGECGYSMGGNKKMSGRSKTPHVTYRCMGKKNRHICDNKEMRREYIETYVLEKLSEYVFDERLISKLVKEYVAYQNSTNSDVIEKKESIKSRLNEVTREAKNLINIMAKTGSNMMLERITELEEEKSILQASYEKICFDNSTPDITEDELTDRFNQAKSMLKYGTLSDTKKLIELFVNKVNVFSDRVEVIFNFHPDLIPYEAFDIKKDYLYDEKQEENDESPSDEDELTYKMEVSTLVGGYCGGGDGSRTRVRKCLLQSFSGRSPFFNIPYVGRQRTASRFR